MDEDTCRVCGREAELVPHTLRGCPVAKDLWMSIGHSVIPDDFFDGFLYDWIEDNIRDHSRLLYGANWPLSFATICSSLWFHRNLVIFEGADAVDTSLVRKAGLLIQEYDRAVSELNRVRKRIPSFVVKQISWKPPPHNWVKINSDGSVINDGAACEGILRDEDSNFVAAFCVNLGSCSITAAELWGAYWSLWLGWQLGYRRVILELDSKVCCASHQEPGSRDPWLL